MLVAFFKPYGVLSQFTPEEGSRWRSLADFDLPKGVYPVGRLDADSEGFLLLTAEPGFNHSFLDPSRGHVREYWAQVEGIPDDASIRRLSEGVMLDNRKTLPATVRRLKSGSSLPHRDPPIRVRKTVPDSWISIELSEGKNRQVRRMTAAVGHPTLRLVRVRMGGLELMSLGLTPGKWRLLTEKERALVLAR